jgi:catechol 2,3-dioxygenase-like lactoylglutathione lyase family enzyme
MWGARNFYFGGGISVGVRDVERAATWYQEKLRLRRTPLKSEDFEALLAFEKDDKEGVALVLIPPGEAKANVEGHPILFTKKIEKVYEEFASRGVSVEPIQSDSGGNRFFRFRDLDGNEIEVCTEPG